MSDKTTVEINGIKVILDSDLMRFNEANLSNYLESEATYFSYFGEKLADAEFELYKAEVRLEALKGEKFKEFKAGLSDKTCQSHVDSDAEVIEATLKVGEMKHVVKILQRHLKAWDIAHENATSRGHTLRKELDKLSFGIRSSDPYSAACGNIDELESRLQEFKNQ